MPRLTQAWVGRLFARSGATLLDTYVNAHTPLRFQCACGRIAYDRVRRLRKPDRKTEAMAQCTVCAGKTPLSDSP